MPELTVRFQGDDDYESDNNSGDEGDEEEEPIVADLDHIKKMSIEEPMIFGALLLIWRTYKSRQKKRLYLSLKSLKSGSSANKNKNRVATRRKHRERELKLLKNKLKSGICTKEASCSTRDSKATLEAQHNLCFQQIGNEMRRAQRYSDRSLHDAGKAKFDTEEDLNFVQQYYINQGLKKFGDDGKDAVDKELRQMLLRDCFTPEFVKDMTASERKKAQSAMMLLAEKQFEKTIKGCLVFQGNGTREWLLQEDTASPTALQEAITTTCVIVLENGKRVNYQTIRFHVDKFAEWLNRRYGSIKACTIVRGKIHRYLGMTLDFLVKGKLKICMDDYVKNMLEDFPIKFNKDSKQGTPAGNDLLEAGKGKLLSAEYRQIFHTTVARGLYVSKRACLNIHPTITILALRVREPTESDWKKCVCMMRYLFCTSLYHLTLSAESLRVIKWMNDASFAVHPDFSTLSFGGGAAQVMSKKQKLNSRSSTEAELIAVDDIVTMILWTKLFMEWQGIQSRRISCIRITKARFYNNN
ncbi:unnamed protein product [Cylindrotheca closterium]|uniref:Uncharacterized protein n=1 Tax=Cylindrotheca closterium TaxID=2856 RepID=A0AAD2GDP6_9STRA|nr:unnamed protein product [Cylindrotheca closterium]